MRIPVNTSTAPAMAAALSVSPSSSHANRPAITGCNNNPTEDEVRWALSGNLCRCTGYQNIVRAVQTGAQGMKGA